MNDVQNPEPYRRRLGRGLSSLLGGGAAPASTEVESTATLELRHIPIDGIDRNPHQPRKAFDGDALAELAGSIREHGVLQPLLVRELDNRFQLVAGERRWLAAQKAGLTVVPCRVMDVIDKTACEVALEENLKRKDLTDLEKAAAFRDYLMHFQCTIEELAKQLSLNRSTVSNLLRLLELPEPVKNALQAGKITAGHARALLSLERQADQLALCGRIQAEGLSVRETEAAVKQVETIAAPADDGATIPMAAAGAAASAGKTDDRTNHVRSLEEQLGALLGTKVEIRLRTRTAGTIRIPFASNDEFERILQQLRRRAA
jgi:ParB family chromosome partitioning protein